MATPATLQGLTDSQQTAINNAIRSATSGVGSGESFGQIENSFNSYLLNPATDAGPNPNGFNFTTAQSNGQPILGTGQSTNISQVDAAFSSVEAHGSGFYEQGSPSVFAGSWIQQVDNFFAPAAAPATPAPPAATPAASPVAPAVPIATPVVDTTQPSTGSGPNLVATPLPASASLTGTTPPTPTQVAAGDTGNPATTTTTTATTGQNLASAAPGTTLGDLLAAIQGSGGTPYGQSSEVSLPPSTVLPTDSGSGTTTSSSSGSSLSTTDVIIYGVIASLIAAAIWWVVTKQKGNPFKKAEESIHHAI